MSSRSPITDESEEEVDSDSMDDSRQYTDIDDEDLVNILPETWSQVMNEDDGVDCRPKTSPLERWRLEEAREKEVMRIAQSRGMAKLPDDCVPEVEPPPPESAEQKKARYDVWLEKLARIRREKEEMLEENMKVARARYEKYAKLQKEYRTRDFYWKPDPLYALHMKELGYSKIAIDKALFYTDNRSVAQAVEYLKQNPNPTELTKEEVMAAGEEILKIIRPMKPHTREQALPKEGEMEIEQASQTLLADDDCLTCITIADDGPEKEGDRPKEVPKKDPVNNHEDMMEYDIRRGVKRNYAGEEVESFPSISKYRRPPVPIFKEVKLEHKMFFMVNASLLMDAITLSLEVGKVVANLTSKMRDGTDELKKMYDDWITEGNKMGMYKGRNSDHLNKVYENMKSAGLLAYLGQCSHYRQVKTPSPTVLGIFCEVKQLKGVHNHWQIM